MPLRHALRQSTKAVKMLFGPLAPWKKYLLLSLGLLLLLGGVKGWRFLRLYQLTSESKTKLNTGDLAGALAIGQRLQASYAGAPHGYMLEGAVRHKQRHFPEALEMMNNAIQRMPNEPALHYYKGIILTSASRYDEAADACGLAVVLDPKNMDTVACRGRAYYLGNHYSQAQQDAEKLIGQDAKDYRGYLLRGDINLYLRYPAKALPDYQQVTQLEPTNTIGFTRQGSAYLEMDQPALAVSVFDRAISLDPRDAKAWKGRGVAYHDLKNYREALKSYQQAEALDASLENMPYLIDNARKRAQVQEQSARCGMGRCGE